MAVGKSSLGRVARSTVIPAPEKETEKLVTAKEETAATEKPATEIKKPRARAAAQKATGVIYAVGDELPVWLL